MTIRPFHIISADETIIPKLSTWYRNWKLREYWVFSRTSPPYVSAVWPWRWKQFTWRLFIRRTSSNIDCNIVRLRTQRTMRNVNYTMTTSSSLASNTTPVTRISHRPTTATTSCKHWTRNGESIDRRNSQNVANVDRKRVSRGVMSGFQ